MKTRSLFLVILALVVLLMGCSRTAIKLGWRESSGRAHKRARYETFSAVERVVIRAKAGQEIDLTYDVEVEKGSLTLAVEGLDGQTVWEETFRENASDTLALTAPDEGHYTLVVTGDETGGSFDISWTAEN